MCEKKQIAGYKFVVYTDPAIDFYPSNKSQLLSKQSGF